VTAERAAAVVGDHLAEDADEVDRGPALGPLQLEVGAVQVTHDPFGIEKV
jgi:hypothetical protein